MIYDLWDMLLSDPRDLKLFARILGRKGAPGNWSAFHCEKETG